MQLVVGSEVSSCVICAFKIQRNKLSTVLIYMFVLTCRTTLTWWLKRFFSREPFWSPPCNFIMFNLIIWSKWSTVMHRGKTENLLNICTTPPYTRLETEVRKSSTLQSSKSAVLQDSLGKKKPKCFLCHLWYLKYNKSKQMKPEKWYIKHLILERTLRIVTTSSEDRQAPLQLMVQLML